MPFLAPGEFERVRPLAPPAHLAGHMAFVHSVLDGEMDGHVLADRRDAPRSAVVCNDSGFWLAIGEADRRLVAANVPELLGRIAEPTVLLATTPAWSAALGAIFGRAGEARPERALSRKEFHFRPAAVPAPPPVPSGYRVVAIDAQIAGEFDGRVDPWVVRIWGGPEEFARRCFGTAIMRDGQVASFCTACAIGGPPGAIEAEIEIGTTEGERQRSLATIAALAFFEQCRARGLTPAWTCAADNVASAKLAARLGFQEFREVAAYSLSNNYGA
ncbi:MAG: GNAT family N-acetyltransferase [Chloroflexi bacterium]|nr:GNAT family N-acetyltransferase [Chloroflexota bacterium]